MTIEQFVNELKHKNTRLILKGTSDTTVFDGTVGVFLTSVVKSSVKNEIILKLIPTVSENGQTVFSINF